MRVIILLILANGYGDTVSGQEVVVPNWAASQQRDVVEWPEHLRGIVLDEAKQPIPNAQILISIDIQLYPPGGFIVEKPVYQTEVKTDKNGKWAVSTENFPQLDHRPVVVNVTASAADRVPWRTYQWFGFRSTKLKEPQQTITLRRGYEVSGRCVDENDVPVKGVRFRVSHPESGIRGEWGLKD